MPGSTAAQRRRAIELAAATGLPVLTVPSIDELRDGGTRIERAARRSSRKTCSAASRCELDEAGIGER